jgi:hypothetical protein
MRISINPFFLKNEIQSVPSHPFNSLNLIGVCDIISILLFSTNDLNNSGDILALPAEFSNELSLP